MSVRQAQAEIDAAEFAEWYAYYQLEPWGEERSDLRMSILASVIANRHRNPKKEQPYKAADFLPKVGAQTEPKRQSAESMKAMFKMMTGQAGGTIVNGKAA